MASHQHPTTVENLPYDVLSKIFIKLLAKQLAQMRSVSKSMNALLSNKSLIKSHLHNSIHNNDEVLLFFYHVFIIPFNKPLSAHPSKSPNVKLTDFIKLPVNLRWGYDSVIGSVNGLICLNHHRDLHIWNPSLSALLTLPPQPSPDGLMGRALDSLRRGLRFESRRVPIRDGHQGSPCNDLGLHLNRQRRVVARGLVYSKSGIPRLERDTKKKKKKKTLPPHFVPSPVNDPIGVSFRFGFDPKADDYKVVKLVRIHRFSSFEVPVWASLFNMVVKEWLGVEVYSMRKGFWKRITQRFPSHVTVVSRQDDVCVDGHDGLLHWLCFIGEEKYRQMIVVAFDLGAETFHEITLPDSILHPNVLYRITALGVMAGKLCVMSYVKSGDCEVWVMDEYGAVESWVKHQALSQFHNIVPFGFTLRNKFLFKVKNIYGDDDDGHRYGLYDPVAAKTDFFQLCAGINKIVGYVDSLVWVEPDERELSSCRISQLQI